MLCFLRSLRRLSELVVRFIYAGFMPNIARAMRRTSAISASESPLSRSATAHRSMAVNKFCAFGWHIRQ